TPAERAALIGAGWPESSATPARSGGPVHAARGAPPLPPAPPLLSAQPRPLPAQLTPLIGRLPEAIELARLVRDPAVRLVTVTGVGGAGKTRLALAVALDIGPELADGVWFVDLAPVDHPALVLPAVAAALGVQGSADLSLLDAVVAALRPRQLVLML